MNKAYINKLRIAISALLLIFVTSCEIDEVIDPNNPSRSKIEENATLGELNNLVAGTESLFRDEIGFYYDAVSIVGREYYFFTDSDPRYTGELLGKGSSILDNAGFYGTHPYASRYRVILNAKILLNALNNTNAGLTTQETNGYIGFAKTLQAHSYLIALNMQGSNGIRFNVNDPDNLGPFLTQAESLTQISNLLDEAYTALNNAGTTFKFTLSSGFTGFNNPQTFGKFNRAIKARVEMYRGNKTAVLTALTNSFMDMNGSLTMGPSHFYSTAGGDIPNPVYRVPGAAEAIVAHPSFSTDVQPNDDRVSLKTTSRGATYTFDGLSGDRDVTIYSSLSSPIKIIRNEELILLHAEANIGTNNTEAINSINKIRTSHNLAAYAGGTTDAEVLNELLYNRRYSLFGEGHRWIDMRRHSRLNQLPIDRANDDVWDKFPRPISEIGVQGG